MKTRWAYVGLGLLGAYLTGAGIALLVRGLGWWPGAAWEEAALHAAQRTTSPVLDAIMLSLPLIGTNYTLAPVVAGAAIILLHYRQNAAAIHLAIVQAGSSLLNIALKYSFPRDRPSLYERRGQHGMTAYPSGHALAVVAVLFTVAWLLWRYRGVKWPAYVVGIFFLLNAYSRIYLSVHWVTDVIGGTAVGAVWFMSCLLACRRTHPNPTGRPEQP